VTTFKPGDRVRITNTLSLHDQVEIGAIGTVIDPADSPAGAAFLLLQVFAVAEDLQIVLVDLDSGQTQSVPVNQMEAVA